MYCSLARHASPFFPQPHLHFPAPIVAPHHVVVSLRMASDMSLAASLAAASALGPAQQDLTGPRIDRQSITAFVWPAHNLPGPCLASGRPPSHTPFVNPGPIAAAALGADPPVDWCELPASARGCLSAPSLGLQAPLVCGHSRPVRSCCGPLQGICLELLMLQVELPPPLPPPPALPPPAAAATNPAVHSPWPSCRALPWRRPGRPPSGPP